MTDTSRKLRQLLANCKTEKVLAVLEKIFDCRGDQTHLNDITMLTSRFNRAKSDRRNGVLSQQDFSLENNLISAAILELMKEVSFTPEDDRIKDEVLQLTEKAPEKPNSGNVLFLRFKSRMKFYGFRIALTITVVLGMTIMAFLRFFPSQVNGDQVLKNSQEYARFSKDLEALNDRIHAKANECGKMKKNNSPVQDCDRCRAELNALNAERDTLQKLAIRFREDVTQIAGTFNKMLVNSKRLSLAKQFFIEGEIREADKALNVNEMQRDWNALLAKTGQEQKAPDNLIRVIADEFALKAILTTMHYDDPLRYDSAEAYFMISRHYYENIDNLLSFAKLLFAHNQYQRSLPYYAEALKLSLSKREQAMIYNEMGQSYENAHRGFEAEQAYLQALAIYEGLAKNDPVEFELKWAKVANNLAEHYREAKKMEEAEKIYRQALKTLVQLQNTEPKKAEPELARTLMNFGIYHSDKGRKNEAEKCYLDAYSIYQRLFEMNPSVFEPDLAKMAMNLGNFYGTDDKARKMHLLSIEIYERLSKNNPPRFEPELAKAAMNLGVYYWSIGEHTLEAKSRFRQSHAIYERLATMNPGQFEPDVAMIELNLGLFYNDQEMPEAENVLLHSYGIFERLSKRDSARFQENLAKVELNLALAYQRNQKMDEAYLLFRRSVKAYEQMVKTNPEKYKPDLATIYGDLSDFYLYKKDFSAAINAARKAILLDPSNTSWINCNLGHAYLLKGKWPEAKKIYSVYLKGENDKAEAIFYMRKDFDKFKAAGIPIPHEKEVQAWLGK